MAMYGVWKRGWMRATTAGSTPSRAKANSVRGLPSMSPDDVAEHRDDRAEQHEQAAALAQHAAGRFRQRRASR